MRRSERTELLWVWFTYRFTQAHPSLAPSPSKSGWVGSDTLLTSQALPLPGFLSYDHRAPAMPGFSGAGEAQGSNAEKPGKDRASPMLLLSSVCAWAIIF